MGSLMLMKEEGVIQQQASVNANDHHHVLAE